MESANPAFNRETRVQGGVQSALVSWMTRRSTTPRPYPHELLDERGEVVDGGGARVQLHHARRRGAHARQVHRAPRSFTTSTPTEIGCARIAILRVPSGRMLVSYIRLEGEEEEEEEEEKEIQRELSAYSKDILKIPPALRSKARPPGSQSSGPPPSASPSFSGSPSFLSFATPPPPLFSPRFRAWHVLLATSSKDAT